MIVEQVGYLKLKDVYAMKENGILFSVYETNKKTVVLVLNTKQKNIHLFYPKKDRLPWKLTEGKKIVRCELVYTSDDIIDSSTISTRGWNNDEQILAYKEFSNFYI